MITVITNKAKNFIKIKHLRREIQKSIEGKNPKF